MPSMHQVSGVYTIETMHSEMHQYIAANDPPHLSCHTKTLSAMNRCFSLLAGLLLLIGTAVAAPVISAAIGDPVTLAGYAPGADGVYLFVTGPNLPANGVRLDDISAPVTSGDPSSFTRTSVDNNRWEYTWYTRMKGGPPDAGTYTIYIVTTPVGRRDLTGSEYATVMVSLGSPGLVVLPEGEVIIRSSSRQADSVPDGVTTGPTSMQISGILQGNRTLDRGENTGPENPLNDTGRKTSPAPSFTVSAPSPAETHPEKIPLPPFAVLTALGCASVSGRVRRKYQDLKGCMAFRLSFSKP
jgi:hypothetical protein